jgi:hypothetical protein
MFLLKTRTCRSVIQKEHRPYDKHHLKCIYKLKGIRIGFLSTFMKGGGWVCLFSMLCSVMNIYIYIYIYAFMYLDTVCMLVEKAA